MKPTYFVQNFMWNAMVTFIFVKNVVLTLKNGFICIVLHAGIDITEKGDAAKAAELPPPT